MSVKPQRRARRIMRGEHSRREGRVVHSSDFRGRIRKRPIERALDCFARQAAGPQQGWIAEAGNDGQFDADGRCAAVDDEIDRDYASRRARAQLWSAKRDRSGLRRAPPGLAEGFEDFLRYLVVGDAPGRWCRGPRSQARRPGIRPPWGETSVSGPGQNVLASRSASASKRASACAAARSTTWADERIERGPSLRFVKACDGFAHWSASAPRP